MPQPLSERIDQMAVEIQTPHGEPIQVLSLDQTALLATQFELPRQRVEIVSLEKGVIPTRYLRNQKTMTAADQARLLKTRAAIIGLGGLGGTVVEILARAGVGQMVLVDGDRFEEHNLNRQLLCAQHLIGYEKARAAQERINQINSALQAEAQVEFLTAENASRLIQNCDVVVDCLDNIFARFDLETAAKQAGIPMVGAAVAGVAGHVTTIFPQDKGLELIYGPRHSIQREKGAETILGCLPQAVTMIAAMESAQVLKILLKQSKGLLRNKLWVVDLTDNTFEVLSLI
ncbi:MAG: ThiF family adenylyltransferase [Desulfobacteraceae bacterium]|nr:ThiF family adenylyltransferase [Desulfobacteraceae bacterium]